jgi:hypothetical protein
LLPAHRGPNARRKPVQMAFTNRLHDTRLEHQERADSAAGATGDAEVTRNRGM